MKIQEMLTGRATYGRHGSSETARRPYDYQGRHRAAERIAVPAARPEPQAADTVVLTVPA